MEGCLRIALFDFKIFGERNDNMANEGMTYTGSGVNYEEMDPFKRMALKEAIPTAENLKRHKFKEVPESRGESAYVIDVGPFLLAFVEEGLGTKNKVAEEMMLIARAMFGSGGDSYHRKIMQCNLAMAVNDLSTVGASPLVSMLHVAAGSSKYFTNEKRNQDIVEGHADACNIAGCSWGGGESPTLRDIIFPGTAVFAGSTTGIINPKSDLLLGSRVQVGDAIILINSSGIHANGLTLARDIAEFLPKGYFTEMPSGKTYGEGLLEPTLIYSRLIDNCAPLLHYAINITGHGFRKLMRAQGSFRYVVEKLPEVPEALSFMQEHGRISNREAYGNLNMGAGYALIAPRENVGRILAIAGGLGYDGHEAGSVESFRRRRVCMVPLGFEYDEDELKVR